MIGDVTDRRLIAMTTDGQQELVLRTGETHGAGLFVAPVQEQAKSVAKRQQSGVVHVGDLRCIHIVTRYYRFTMIAQPSTRRVALLALLAVFMGFAGGGAAWLLVHLIELITNVALFHRFDFEMRLMTEFHPGPWLFVAAIGGALIVSLLARWAPVIRGHGIPETMEAVLTKQSRISPRTVIAKPLSAAVAIGTGAPFGAEGPIIVTSGSLGSLVGQILPVSPSERKILLACGAAAGMAATFGAPLAAVVLAIELLIFEFSVRAFVPLVVATAVAGGMHSALFGAGPLFQVPSHDYAGLAVLPKFVVLGVACGGLAIVISRGLFLVEHWYRRSGIPAFWQPVVGAIGFATVGLFVPRALGVGYDAIGDVTNSRVALGAAAALAIGKLVAWWLALGSGTSGGTLAPVLLISASFGVVMGSVLNRLLPGPDLAVGAFAVVAMAATFGAAAQATFTSIVFVFELTRDYNVILPLMLASVIADLIYSAVNADSLMTEKLSRRGLHVGRHYGTDPFTTTRVERIMSSPVVSIDATSTVGEARRRFASHGHGAYPIVSDGRLVGIVSRGDLISTTLGDDAPIGEVATAEVATVRPTDQAQVALRVMVDEHVEHVPVVDDDGRLAGICTRADLLKVRRQQLDLERIQVPESRRAGFGVTTLGPGEP